MQLLDVVAFTLKIYAIFMKQRSDGRWQRAITVDGKRICFYSRETTEKKAIKDVERQLLAYKEKQERGAEFIEVADEWDSIYREDIPEITYNKSIKKAYERITDYFSDQAIKDVTARDVDVFLHSLKYGQKTVANHKSILNMIFDHAVLHGYVTSNPVSSVRLPKGLTKTKRELPTSRELDIVSSHWDGFALLPFFLLYTGCRKSEALAIRREDIDYKNNIIKIRNHVIHDGNRPVFEDVLKSEAAHRDIILLNRLKNVFPKHFSGFLFSMDGDGKRPLTKGAFDKRWKSYCKQYGLEITAHQLRHGFATMLFEANIDLKDAQELMGHSDINLTRSVYTHIRDKRKQQTADKLNAFFF